ncbi:N-acetyl-gamma-glutamyl-phosphate reductase [Leptospira sp. 96542]|nr:N-acetyl-gamma-glutamyl-phosphate reductase [Leptospira sp. 96542]
MAKSKLAIIGAGGLTGKELLTLLANHPGFEVVHITSNQVNGKHVRDVFPDVSRLPNLSFEKHDAAIPDGAGVVLATPNEASLEMAPKLRKESRKVIDLSGTFRLHNKQTFESAYKFEHTAFSLMDEVVFGIPELFREKLKNANFVSNPGCFSTSVILPLALLGNLRKQILSPVIVDAKSGVSGAGGRTEEITYAYTNVAENLRAYKIFNHQHEPEMEEYGYLGLKSKGILFTPHLLPVYRGILSAIYIQFDSDVNETEIKNIYKQKVAEEPFLRFYETPEEVELRKVQNTNYLDFGIRVRKNNLVIISALDNLQKGAAGQALQNLNLMYGYPETEGLTFV